MYDFFDEKRRFNHNCGSTGIIIGLLPSLLRLPPLPLLLQLTRQPLAPHRQLLVSSSLLLECCYLLLVAIEGGLELSVLGFEVLYGLLQPLHLLAVALALPLILLFQILQTLNQLLLLYFLLLDVVLEEFEGVLLLSYRVV